MYENVTSEPAAAAHGSPPCLTALAGRPVPLDLEAYRGSGGFRSLEALPRALERLDALGLRERGRGGEPLAPLWRGLRGQRPVLVAHAAEGPAGALLSSWLLDRVPYLVLDGLLAAARFLDAPRALLVLPPGREETADQARAALDKLAQAGLLEADGTPLDVACHVTEDPWTALEPRALAADVEDRAGRAGVRAEPAPRLDGRPAAVHTAETLAALACALPDAAPGDEPWPARGARLYHLTGAVENPGAVEAAPAASFEDVARARDESAGSLVRLGGLFGAILPADWQGGAAAAEDAFGDGFLPGVLDILPPGTCPLAEALRAAEAARRLSCGRCTPCRTGNRSIWQLLTRMEEGRAWRDDASGLEALASVVADASLCRFGRRSAAPLRSCLDAFPDLVREHAEQGLCPRRGGGA